MKEIKEWCMYIYITDIFNIVTIWLITSIPYTYTYTYYIIYWVREYKYVKVSEHAFAPN